MENTERHQFEEQDQGIVVEVPAIETFLNLTESQQVWPEEITSNPDFRNQIEFHRELNDAINSVTDSIPRPDIDIEVAINQGYISEQQVENLYTALGKHLDDDEYKRILLYLPFEYLPSKDWKPESERLEQAKEEFTTKYLDAWKKLLYAQDVRANFVDGDVLETDMRTGDLPRAVKAAHLIPFMVQKGILQVKEVVKIYNESDDQILRDSIADSLFVLDDLTLIPEEDFSAMESHLESAIRESRAEVEDLSLTKEVTFASIKTILDNKLLDIENEDYEDLSERRIVWLKETKRHQVIQELGGDLSLLLRENKIGQTELDQAEKDSNIDLVVIEGIRKAVEQEIKDNPQKAKEIFEEHKNSLLKFWESENLEIRTALEKTFRRLFQLGVVEDQLLIQMGIEIPHLAGPFSENLKLMPGEIRNIKRIMYLVEHDPELISMIYPIAMVQGSRLKGYGAPTSDLDISVFVRPTTSEEDKEKLKSILRNTFGEAVEFWLEFSGDKLKVKDLPYSAEPYGGKTWLHVLFGSAWIGDSDSVKEIREKLLSSYLYKTNETMYGRNIRKIYLEEMERDNLQYRLMHKGYERHFPSFGGIDTPRSSAIDSKSMFYDSGYRKTATKLFASRVFLPKISK